MKLQTLAQCRRLLTIAAMALLPSDTNAQVAMMIMQRSGASPGSGETGMLGALPASFSGNLPCADCPGIRYVLNLFPDKSFFVRLAYSGRGEGTSSYDIGRWELSSDGSALVLKGGKKNQERFAVKSAGVLRKLDLEGREIDSKFNYDLRRDSAFERIEPRLTMRGMCQYMADAPTFKECQTGQRWPVAMEGRVQSVGIGLWQSGPVFWSGGSRHS